MELFGFQIKRKSEDNENIRSFAEPNNDDGAVTVSGVAGTTSSFLDLEGTAKSEAQLIQKYREMIQQPEIQYAVDDIVNEAINITHDDKPVECVTEDLNLSDGVKKKIREEFDNILGMLNFSTQGYDIFHKWYVDGRLNYHVLIDEQNPKKGIQELRYIDPRKIRKVREYKTDRVGNQGNVGYSKKIKNEYYVYTDKGFYTNTNQSFQNNMHETTGLKIAKDSIIHCNSGVLNENNTLVLSHLHKAYKPLNQLRMMEDAVVIYRISRAPERRVFYIDVGNMPRSQAEKYMQDMMKKHKNKMVYDATTGEVRDDKRHMAMTDDFWMARREGGRGTEIDTLQGGQNLGELEDVLYFQKRLYKALNVPITRLEPEAGFTLGRASEITRDEVKFSKFVRRLRIRFSILFNKILEKQLILKGIISPKDWDTIEKNIRYNFMSDTYFEELKESEILTNRLQIIRDIDEYTGRYYSKSWVRRNVLKFSENEIEEMDKEIEEESENEPDESLDDLNI